MLARLEKAENTPDKGWRTSPKFEVPEEVMSDEEDCEVMLLEDSNEENSNQESGMKRCLSNQVKDPMKYVCSKYFKIPKKSTPENDNHSNNILTRKRVASVTPSPVSDNHHNSNDKNWGFKSAFEKGNSSMKTKLTRNTTRRSVGLRDIRSMVERQDKDFAKLRRQSSQRNAGNTQVEVKTILRKDKDRDEPFDHKIQMVKEKSRNERTEDRNCTVKKELFGQNLKSRRTVVFNPESKESETSEQESDASKDYGLNEGFLCGESTAEDSEDQYFEDLHKEKLKSLSNDSEKVNLGVKSKDYEENPSRKNNDQQCRVINFPSSAATPRHSIHEYTTSDDEEEKKSNAKTFYASKVIKTYGIKKSRRINCDKTVAWSKDDNIDEEKEIDITSSEVEESTVKSTKKRKTSHDKMNVKNGDKNRSTDSGKQRKKFKAEPDFYLISSSDEENTSGLEEGNKSESESSKAKKNLKDSSIASSKNTAEDSIADGEDGGSLFKSSGAVDNPFERDSFTAEIMIGPKVMLGSLHGLANGALEITAHQLKWKMNYKVNDKLVERVILILASDLTSFKIHVDQDPKVIVLGVNHRCALNLRGKINGMGKFLDPSSPVVEETEIVLQVDDTLTAEIIADITEWVKDRLCRSFEELSVSEAKQVNERVNSGSADSAVKTPDDSKLVTLHYNTRSSSTKTRTHVTPTKMIIYPSPPIQGGITVTSADIECLAEGEFLNDVIIDFYLKYIYHDKLSDDEKARTHVFSSFFYKRLTQKNNSGNNSDFFQSNQERMHSQVKKWTRHVDIFSKDFIIVPINESSHWYLAVICFPYLTEPIMEQCSSQESSQECVIEDSTDSDEKDKVEEEEDDDKKNGDGDNGDRDRDRDRDRADGDGNDEDEDDADLEKSSLAVGAKKSTPSKKFKTKKEVMVANPCILIFDSLGTGGRSRVFTNLRSYLTCEWKAKKPDEQTRQFTSETFKGAFPKVPEQNNHCDCGIFVLQYVESFFENPIKDYKTPIHKKDWFTLQGISGKRQYIKNLIIELKEKHS